MARALVEIQGFAELQEKIKKLADPKDKKRELVAVLRQVALTTVRVAKAETPISKKPHVARKKVINPGNLQKSIGTIVGRKGSAKDNPTVYVGPRAKGSNDGWYGNFVALGHNIYKKGFKRKRSKAANNAAGVSSTTKANNFMKRAYEQTQGNVSAELETRVAKFIQKRIDKLSS